MITNAVKYAFHKSKEGIIHIELKQEAENILLKISDNGKGMKEKVDLTSASSLGFQIVYAMITQNHGSIDYMVDNGTKFIITLPRNRVTIVI